MSMSRRSTRSSSSAAAKHSASEGTPQQRTCNDDDDYFSPPSEEELEQEPLSPSSMSSQMKTTSLHKKAVIFAEGDLMPGKNRTRIDVRMPVGSVQSLDAIPVTIRVDSWTLADEKKHGRKNEPRFENDSFILVNDDSSDEDSDVDDETRALEEPKLNLSSDFSDLRYAVDVKLRKANLAVCKRNKPRVYFIRSVSVTDAKVRKTMPKSDPLEPLLKSNCNKDGWKLADIPLGRYIPKLSPKGPRPEPPPTPESDESSVESGTNQSSYDRLVEEWEGPYKVEELLLDVLVFAEDKSAVNGSGGGGDSGGGNAAGRSSSSRVRRSDSDLDDGGLERELSESDQHCNLRKLNVTLLGPVYKDEDSGYYTVENATAVARFDVNVTPNYRLGELRKACLKKALEQPAYKGKVGANSSIFLQEGTQKSKNCSFVKSVKDVWRVVNEKVKKTAKRNEFECKLSLAVGRRNEDKGDEELTKEMIRDIPTHEVNEYSQQLASEDVHPGASPMKKIGKQTSQDRADASRSADRDAKAFLLRLYRLDNPGNPFYKGINGPTLKQYTYYFSRKYFGSGASKKRAWDFFDVENDEWPIGEHLPDFNDPFYRNLPDRQYLKEPVRDSCPPGQNMLPPEPNRPSGETSAIGSAQFNPLAQSISTGQGMAAIAHANLVAHTPPPPGGAQAGPSGAGQSSSSAEKEISDMAAKVVVKLQAAYSMDRSGSSDDGGSDEELDVLDEMDSQLGDKNSRLYRHIVASVQGSEEKPTVDDLYALLFKIAQRIVGKQKKKARSG